MHKENVYKKWSNYAKILLVISIVFIVYGIGLEVFSTDHLIDPIHDVVPIVESEEVISITTVDGSEVVSNSPEVVEEIPESVTVPSETVVTPEESHAQSSIIRAPSLTEVNNTLRNEIQSTYGILILYGEETDGYTIHSGNTTIYTNPIKNETTINSQLVRLQNSLSYYPVSLFQEIRNGGIPLTITLVESFSEGSITGITDSSYSYANISIASSYSFEESFYHESYHYIERYMFKKGVNFSSWDSLNPVGFTYGNISSELSYSNTFSSYAPFVNNYAQTSGAEDRASTFEYMMANSKASCMNYGTSVWNKSKYIALTMEAALNSVSPSVIEHWEQYL